VASLAIAVTLGAAIFAWLIDPDPDPQMLAHFGALRLWVADFATVFSWGGLLTGALYFLERERRIGAATRQASLDRIEADGQLAEAQLQMLQAQIEPHFLFNSLATVQSLYQQDAVRGRQLLRDLSEYLRGALPQMRGAASTLRKEFALCQAYLRVLQVRMGDRLKVEIELPPALENMSVPPMMLPTLIENAIKHGIAPLPRGGTMRIEARRVAASLQVSVSDNGAGFRHTSGSGIGLANTRARLASLFGKEASLSVAANSGSGVTATLRFPLEDAAHGHPA
jgi:LytS/YehU family sensor histidine kinase